DHIVVIETSRQRFPNSGCRDLQEHRRPTLEVDSCLELRVLPLRTKTCSRAQYPGYHALHAGRGFPDHPLVCSEARCLLQAEQVYTIGFGETTSRPCQSY